MKVLFIRPYSVVFTKPYFTAKAPLNLGYLSAYLKKNGHEVRVLDFSLKNDPAELVRVLREYGPRVVGISAYTPNVLDGFEAIKTVKSEDNGCVTVMGGPHSTSVPEETLKACDALDIVVIGEGEVTLQELCDTIERGGDINRVAGLCRRHEGAISRTAPRHLIEDLDSLPFPDRDIIALSYRNLRFFDHNLNLPLEKIMEVTTTRGCTDNCTFCTAHRAFTEKGRSLRLRRAENVLEEIEEYKAKSGIRHVQFLDDNFPVSKERTRRIINGLKAMGLTWNCDARVNLIDRDLIREMVESGCRKVSIGVESGSEKILKMINKNITVEQIRDAFRWCHEAGLETIQANFLIGSHPEETPEDIELTRNLIKEIRPQRLLLSIIVPFPGTKVREQMLERGLISSDDWRRYMLMNDEPPPWRTVHFSSEELRDLQNRMITEFYFDPRNIVTNLKYIRSLDLLWIYLRSGIGVLSRYVQNGLKSLVKR